MSYVTQGVRVPTFNPARDVQKAIVVMFAEVSRVQPSLRIQSLFRLLRHVEVSHEHVSPPETDLSIPVGVLFI